LGGLASLAATACLPEAKSSQAAPVRQEEATPQPPPAVAPTETAAAQPAAPPAPTAPPEPPPEPRLTRLGAQGSVQPFFQADGARVLFYDQPAPGQGGTWSIDPATAQARLERPHWGNYVSGGTLVVTPRPGSRDTYVVHLPSGREWTLPTTNGAVFSPQGTVVAYSAAAATQGFTGQAAPFALSAIVVSGADAQAARRVPLPVNGSVVAWVPAPDGTPDVCLLLSGRRAERDDPSLWTYDLRDGALSELTRSKRVSGVLASPDGTWLAHVAMWNPDPNDNGLWVTRTDGSLRRRVSLLGSYRWTADNRLLMVPVRSSADDGHQVWEVLPDSGTAHRLIDPQKLRLRIANHDWDISPDGQQLSFVSADDRSLWHLSLPDGMVFQASATVPEVPAPAAAGTNGKPYRLPFADPPGPSSWYVAHWYGLTTGGYRGRNTTYSQGQGIHFGIDFAAACGTPVVAISAGQVIAVDGGYGSPPHNVVLQLPDGNQAVYGHLVERSRHVQVGQTVQPGQVIGNTGDSIAPYNCTRNPHLHLEIRKGGRAVATNPVPYFDVNWDDLSLGVFPGPRFERNLDDPKRHQFLDDQPDIRFGGPIISNFGRPWPP
jgi:hypothetical protein